MFTTHVQHIVVVGCDNTEVANFERLYTLENPNHQRHAAEEPKRFPGKACCAEPCRNYCQDRQLSLRAREVAARFTPVKIRKLHNEGKR